MKEYERKFLVNTLPDLKCIEPIVYERYFVYIGEDGKEQVRVQKRGEKCEIESSSTTYKKKISISQQAFEELVKDCNKVIRRDNYLISENIKVKLYRGDYEGLVIVDIEFPDAEQFYNYKKPDWLGPEITSTELGKDGSIILLSREEVLEKIKYYQEQEKEKGER